MNSKKLQKQLSEHEGSNKSRIPRPLGSKDLQRSHSLQSSSKEKWMKANINTTPNGVAKQGGQTLCLIENDKNRQNQQNSNIRLSCSELGSLTSTPVPSCDADEMDSLKSFGSACSAFSLDAYLMTNNQMPSHFHGRKKNILHCQTHHPVQEEYLTPTQRQAREIRHLKSLLLKTQKELEKKTTSITELSKEIANLQLHKNEPDSNNFSSQANGDKTDFCPSLSKSCDSGQFESSECSDPGIKDDTVDEMNMNIAEENALSANKKTLFDTKNFEEYYRFQLEEIKRQQANEFQELKERYNDKIEHLLLKLSDANARYYDQRPQLESAHERIRKLETQLRILQEEQNIQESRHHQMYLKMYKKGQEAARFEHADEVLEFAHQAPNRISVPELLQQLHTTEHELDRMKNLYRREIYKKVDGVKDAEVTLRFLKDAIYYFLIDKDNRGHLQAIESIMGYSDIERMNIERALLTRHKLLK